MNIYDELDEYIILGIEETLNLLIENHGNLTLIIIPKNCNFSGEYVITSIKSIPNLKKLEFRNENCNFSVIKPILSYDEESTSIMFLNDCYETEMVLQIPLKCNTSLKGNIIFCSDCGKGMHFKKNRKGYVCGNFNKHGIKACSSHIVREATLTNIILSDIKQFVNDVKTTTLYDNLNLEINNQVIQFQNTLKGYVSELDKLKKRKSKSITMLIDDIITKSDYNLFINEIDEQIKSLEHNIIISQQSLDKIASGSFLDELAKIKYEALPLDELTPKILHRFVNKIEIEEDGHPIISYRLLKPLLTLVS